MAFLCRRRTADSCRNVRYEGTPDERANLGLIGCGDRPSTDGTFAAADMSRYSLGIRYEARRNDLAKNLFNWLFEFYIAVCPSYLLFNVVE